MRMADGISIGDEPIGEPADWRHERYGMDDTPPSLWAAMAEMRRQYMAKFLAWLDREIVGGL